MLGFILCPECGYKDIMRSREYQKNLSPQRRQEINQRHYERMKKFTDAGLCRCGREREDQSFKLCLRCRIYQREYNRQHAHRVRWKETGVCRYCGSQEVVEGKTLCPRCLKKARATALENLSKAKPETHTSGG